MFFECSNVTELDVSNFNTANVTDMHGTFYGCSALTQLDVSNFNTDKVTRMALMFEGCSGLTELDLRSFNTSNIDYISNMFKDCINLVTIYATQNFDISHVNDSAAYEIFNNCPRLKGGNGTLYSSSHIDKTYARIDQDGAPGYFTSLDIYAKLYTDGTLILSNTDYTDSNRTVNKNYGNVINGTNSYFHNTAWLIDRDNIQQVIIKDRIQPERVDYWFYECSNMDGITGIEKLDTKRVTNMSHMFAECYDVESLNLSTFDTSKVTDMSNMFEHCYGLTNLNISSFNTSNVEFMKGMFIDCRELTNLNLSNFNTSKVTDMSEMFKWCEGLTNLNISSFNTSKVTDMSEMFSRCGKINKFKFK